MTRIFLALVRFILGRYAPKWAAAVAGAQQGYEAGVKQEQDRAEVKLQRVEAQVEKRQAEAHAQVVAAADPDAVVDEQLRELGLVTDDRSAGGDACATSAPGPADRKDQGG